MAAWSVLESTKFITGDRPMTCPWHAYAEPAVMDVLQLYRACSTGWGVQPAAIRHSNPPHYAWQGLLHYTHAVNLIRGYDEDQRDKNKTRR